MLRPWSSPNPSLGGLVEHECPRCHREVELPLGALCAPCRAEIEHRARRVSRWVAAGSTAVVAAYVMLRMPDNDQARVVGLVGILMWFVLTTMVARRVMRQWER